MKSWWKNAGIKWRMIVLLVLCWLVPVIAASISVSVVVSRRFAAQMSETAVNSSDWVIRLTKAQLENCRKDSRNATYFGFIKESYNDYLNSGNEQQLYSDISFYLAQQYRYNESTKSVMLFFTADPNLFYCTYSAGTSYNDILRFKENRLFDALKLSQRLDTAMYLYTADGECYLMRNMVDSSYQPYAVLVMQLNTGAVFGSLENAWSFEQAAVYADDVLIYESGRNAGLKDNSRKGDREDEKSITQSDGLHEVYGVIKDAAESCDGPEFRRINGSYYTCFSELSDGRMLTYIIKLNSDEILSEQKTFGYIMLILLVSLIPLSIVVMVFFDRSVSDPVKELVKGADEIANENYGYQIEDKVYSKEFVRVDKAFNSMSLKLKQQFEQIYLEELMVRDANIKALQSQINPHFINNTLEIINWEARLNGVYKVSGMIEALSTMLNATLNRKNARCIPLSEELEYVDAYLYIISERMGKRLTIEKQIDETLLREMVPKLIAQPIIENAVEHGVTTTGAGKITIRVYAKDEFMYLEVRNTGKLSEQDKKKVESILSGDYDESKERSVSIGISNVNRRLKLMYGDECGLTITSDEEGTLSRLTFLREKELSE